MSKKQRIVIYVCLAIMAAVLLSIFPFPWRQQPTVIHVHVPDKIEVELHDIEWYKAMGSSY